MKWPANGRADETDPGPGGFQPFCLSLFGGQWLSLRAGERRSHRRDHSLLYVLLTTHFFSLATTLHNYLKHGSHMFQLFTVPNSSPLRKEHLFLCSFAGHSWPIPVCLLVHSVNTESKDCSKKRQTGQSINPVLPSTDAASNCS